MEIIAMILVYTIPAIILYFIIKFAVKNAIKESMEDVENSIKKSIKKVLNETTEPPKQCNRCLKKCTYKFCVNERLVKAHDGNYEEGIFFAGRDAWKINEILSVKEIFDRFKKVFKE